MAVQILWSRGICHLPLPRVPPHRVDVLHGQAGAPPSPLLPPRRVSISIFKRPVRPVSPTHRPARRRGRVVSLEQLTPSRSGVFLPTTQIVRDVKYGPNPRNRLDLYLPRGCAYQGEVVVDAPGASPRATPDANGDPGGKGRPVIVFVTGGMWIIGYKAWGALLAQTLMARGFIVASLDYRNFPQGTVGDMIQDVGAGIGWVSRRAASLGGDPSRVFVVGQSAGAHLAATAMLRQSEWERGDLRRGSSPWSPKSLAGFVGISGVYAPDDGKLVEHFNTKGLYREVFYSIMEAGFSGSRAEEALPRASPCAILREQSTTPGLVAEQPPVLLCHGSADTSAPPSQSADYAAALRSAGAREVTERYYLGKTHTDPFVTDPILGGRDELLEDIVAFVRGEGEPFGTGKFPEMPALLPRPLVAIARTMVPF